MAERKDIEIFFRIEGLEAYITDLETLDSVLQQVNNATKQTKESTDKLEESTENFEELERRLQAMEGGVKTLAGSLEFLAGAASLLGIENNEFFESLEENTLGILALARGAIDISEGYALLRKNTQLVTIAQAAFNRVANANPYVLLAGAVVSLAGAIGIYTLATKDDTVATKENYDEKAKLLETEQELARLREDVAVRASDIANLEAGERKIYIDGIRANQKATQDEIDLLEDRIQSMLRSSNGVAFMTKAEREQFDAVQDNLTQLKQELELDEELIDKINLIIKNRKSQTTATNELAKASKDLYDILVPLDITDIVEKDEFETTIQQLTRLRKEIEDTKNALQPSTTTPIPITDEADTWLVGWQKAFNTFAEEPEKVFDGLRRDSEAAINFLSALNEGFSKDEEKRAKRGFQIQKALSLATATINGTEAVLNAFKTAAASPITTAFPAYPFIAASAAGALAAAQIAAISRQQFEGGGNEPDVNVPPPAVPNLSFRTQQQPGQPITPGQTSAGQPAPIQAYVLVSDVNNAQQAQQQIDNLRKL